MKTRYYGISTTKIVKADGNYCSENCPNLNDHYCHLFDEYLTRVKSKHLRCAQCVKECTYARSLLITELIPFKDIGEQK